MSRAELNEYRAYTQSRYDEWLNATEKRGISYGEIAYIEGLGKKKLDEMNAKLDAGVGGVK